MPLHPQVATLLDQMRATGGPPLETMTVEEARAAQRAATDRLGGPVEEVASTLELDGPVPLRLYHPLGSSDGGPLGGVLYLHGGGWVAGDLGTHDRVCRALANRSGAAVIAVDYRLAPEHPFPAGLDDGIAALGWTRAHAAELGVDPDRMAIAGDSAGGNLAAVIVRRDRDAGGGPPLRLQLLVYPVVDAAMDSPSYSENGDGYHLTHAGMGWYWNHYLGAADPLDPDASPLHAADLRGLPPAWVVTAEHDPLRDEGEAYAEALHAAGVAVTCQRRPGMIHGFLRWGGAVDDAGAVIDEAAAALREALR